VPFGTLHPWVTDLTCAPHVPEESEGPKGSEAGCHGQSLIGVGQQARKSHSDPPSGSRRRSTSYVSIALLCVCCNRPNRRATEPRDELPPVHSITSSAMASRIGGISMLSVLAVCRLITNSNFVGCIQIGGSFALEETAGINAPPARLRHSTRLMRRGMLATSLPGAQWG
jgi:hypothetical protein